MNTFLHFLKNLKSIPMVTTWELKELAQMKGHQERKEIVVWECEISPPDMLISNLHNKLKKI